MGIGEFMCSTVKSTPTHASSRKVHESLDGGINGKVRGVAGFFLFPFFLFFFVQPVMFDVCLRESMEQVYVIQLRLGHSLCRRCPGYTRFFIRIFFFRAFFWTSVK